MPTDQLVKVEPILERPRVKIDGESFDQWKDLSITMDAANKTATFSLAVGPNLGGAIDRVEMLPPEEDAAEKLAESGSSGRLYPGALAEILFGEVQMIRGVVNSQSVQLSGSSESFGASGACMLQILRESDLPSNLKAFGPAQAVEQYRQSKTDQERQQNAVLVMRAIAENVIEGMKVSYRTVAFAGVNIHAIELTGGSLTSEIRRPDRTSAYDYLDTVARQLGYRDVWMDGAGILQIGDLSTVRATRRAEIESQGGPDLRLYCFRDPALSMYNNVLDVNVTRSIRSVYTEVVCYDTGTGKTARRRVPIRGRASNPTLAVTKKRYIQCREIGTQAAADLSARNTMEQGREGEFSLTGTAVGYGQRIDGQDNFFKPNEPVQVVHELAGINWPGPTKGKFYLNTVTFSCNVSGGPQTSLSIRHELPPSKASSQQS